MPVSGFEPEKHSPFWSAVVRRGIMQCFSSRPTDKKIKMLEQDSWLPVNLNQNRIIRSQPQLLATQLLYGREEWLPPNGYSHQLLKQRFVRFLRGYGLANPCFFNFMLILTSNRTCCFSAYKCVLYGQATHLFSHQTSLLKFKELYLSCYLRRNIISFCKYTNFFFKKQK